MRSEFTAQVEQTGSQYRFAVSGASAPYRITYAPILHPEQISDFAHNISGPSFQQKAPAPGRLLFYVTDSKDRTIPCAARLIARAGIENLRDLGGYRTQDGRQVRFGMFYRSAALVKMNRKAREEFQTLGIRTVLDFRSSMETADDPDWIAPGWRYLQVSGIQTMDDEFGGGNLDMRRQILRSSGKPELLDQLENYLTGSYRTMAEQPEAYRRMFRAILEEAGTPLLFHCTAGKDRTGVGAALLLSALGVPYEMVKQDYLLSNRCREKENKSIERKVRLFVRDKRLRRIISDMMQVRESYLARTFETIEDLYGGFQSFLHGALEVTPEEQAQLQERFLYPAPAHSA